MTTPSELLCRAADLIRDTAAAATKPPWLIEYDYTGADPQALFRMDPEHPDDPDHSFSLGGMIYGPDNAWAALMSPAVAELVINWLEAEIACIASVDDVQRIMPKILDGIKPGAGDEDTTITVTVDTSGPALAFARYVIKALTGEEVDSDV